MEDLVAGVKRSMDWKQLLESITESVDEEVRLRNAYLYAERRCSKGVDVLFSVSVCAAQQLQDDCVAT
jgi:hypothetical protein